MCADKEVSRTKGYLQFQPLKCRLFGERMAKNDSRNCGHHHKIFLANCFVLVLTLV